MTGWTLQDSAANVWVASVPTGVDSRQLYVDGALAPRSSMAISRNDVQITTTGMTITNPALNFLATLPRQNRIEVESQNSFTDRFAPVDHISGKSFRQWHDEFSLTRKPEHLFWITIFYLTQFKFVPRGLVRSLAGGAFYTAVTCPCGRH